MIQDDLTVTLKQVRRSRRRPQLSLLIVKLVHALNSPFLEEDDTFGLDEKQLQELGDEEADALLAELAHSQSEVARMIDEQRRGAADLSGLRDSLSAELEALKQEAWKMQMFGELESLKKQLESIQLLDKDLDAAESILDGHTEGGDGFDQQAAASHSAALNGAEAEGEEEEEDGADLREIAELQANLDLELAQMMAQLKSVRAEAAAAATRKEELKKELAALLAGDGDYGEEEEVASQEEAPVVPAPSEVPA